MNPSMRKELWAFELGTPFGRFFKFVRADNFSSAKRIVVKWAKENHLEFDAKILSYKRIETLDALASLEGMLLEE